MGELARRRFGGISQLKELKYELAVPKICGAFWLAKEKLNLGNDGMALRKAETLVVKQFLIAFVIRAGVLSSMGKLLGGVCEPVVHS